METPGPYSGGGDGAGEFRTEVPIRIVIADDDTLFREGLVALLRRERDLEVVGEAARGREVLGVVKETRPDVLLLDLLMPEVGGPEIIYQIRQLSPSTKVLIFNNDFEREPVFQALREGAKGYLQKSMSGAQLFKAIRVVHAGEAWIERNVMSHVLEEVPRQEDQIKKGGRSAHRLSPREAEVARFVAEGLSNQEVADRLSVSEKTVKSHLANIFRKLQVRHRLQLALYTLQQHSTESQ
ncbi:MAG: response regulator [Candidatus Methylomirabilales bacterium]